MKTPHNTNEGGLKIPPENGYIRECADNRLRKPENFFHHFFERLADSNPHKLQELMQVFNKWILREFRENGKVLREFITENKVNIELFFKNLGGFIGYGLISGISNEAYKTLDTIGIGEENPNLDLQVQLLTDKILENPDKFFSELYGKVAQLMEKAGDFGTNPSERKKMIFKNFIFHFLRRPHSVFGDFRELPIGHVRDMYGVNDEFEQAFELGRLGVDSPLLTGWEALRYSVRIAEYNNARNSLNIRGALYRHRHILPNVVINLKYFDLVAKKYISRLTPVEYGSYFFFRPIPEHEQACIHDFFNILLSASQTNEDQRHSGMDEVSGVIKYFAEAFMIDNLRQLNDVVRVNGVFQNNKGHEFPATKIVEQYGDALPYKIMYLLSQRDASYKLLEHKDFTGSDEYLLEISNTKVVEERLRLLIEIGHDPDCIRCKIFRGTPYDISGKNADEESTGRIDKCVRYFMPESEFFLSVQQTGEVVLQDRDCTFEERLYSRIEQIVKSFLSPEDTSLSQQTRENIDRLLRCQRSGILTDKNMPFYVATIAKLVIDIVIRSANGREISSIQDLYGAIDELLNKDSDIWNIIAIKEFQNTSEARGRNQVFLPYPVRYPQPYDFSSGTSLKKLRDNLLKSYKINESEADMHDKGTILDLFLVGGSAWNRDRMFGFFRLSEKERTRLLKLFEYVDKPEDNAEKLFRIKQLEFYRQLFKLDELMAIGHLQSTEMVIKDYIGNYIDSFLGITNKLFSNSSGRHGLKILTDLQDLPSQEREEMKLFWQKVRNRLLAVLKKAVELPSEESWGRIIQYDPKYKLAEVIIIFNAIAKELGIREISGKWIKNLQKDWHRRYKLKSESDYFERFEDNQAQLEEDFKISRVELRKDINRNFKRKNLHLQHEKMEFILRVYSDLDFLQLWKGDYKAAFAQKDKFDTVITRFIKQNFLYLMDFLFADSNRWDEEEYGDILIYIFNKLDDTSQIRLLEKLNLLQFFHGELGDILPDEVETIINIPKALQKLCNYVMSCGKNKKIKKLATDRIIGYSKLMHRKNILGSYYPNPLRPAKHEIRLII